MLRSFESHLLRRVSVGGGVGVRGGPRGWRQFWCEVVRGWKGVYQRTAGMQYVRGPMSALSVASDGERGRGGGSCARQL